MSKVSINQIRVWKYGQNPFIVVGIKEDEDNKMWAEVRQLSRSNLILTYNLSQLEAHTEEMKNDC